MTSDDTTVVRRRCDKPMAEKKGFLPCDNDCKNCLACIEELKCGENRHVSLQSNKDREKYIKRKSAI